MLSSRTIHRSQSLQAQTYQALRTAILSGEFVAGERLVETQLAETLQVSRTPIREALRQLQQENLVTIDPANGGLRVAALSVEDAAHLYDCRLALEQLSVSQACQNATLEQLAALQTVVQQAETMISQRLDAGRNQQLLQIDYQFHHLIAEASGNPWLVGLMDQIFDKMALLRLRTLQHNPKVLEIRGEHRRIYEAIAVRNPESALQAIQDHLTASKTRVTQEIQAIDP